MSFLIEKYIIPTDDKKIRFMTLQIMKFYYVALMRSSFILIERME